MLHRHVVTGVIWWCQHSMLPFRPVTADIKVPVTLMSGTFYPYDVDVVYLLADLSSMRRSECQSSKSLTDKILRQCCTELHIIFVYETRHRFLSICDVWLYTNLRHQIMMKESKPNITYDTFGLFIALMDIHDAYYRHEWYFGILYALDSYGRLISSS